MVDVTALAPLSTSSTLDRLPHRMTLKMVDDLLKAKHTFNLARYIPYSGQLTCVTSADTLFCCSNIPCAFS